MTDTTILIVDDDPMMQTLMQTILTPNYGVCIANSGALALEMVTSEIHPDLILLDVIMPEMDGYATLLRLKENPGTRDIPVILVSSMETAEDQANGLALGAVDYIIKPVRDAKYLIEEGSLNLPFAYLATAIFMGFFIAFYSRLRVRVPRHASSERCFAHYDV